MDLNKKWSKAIDTSLEDVAKIRARLKEKKLVAVELKAPQDEELYLATELSQESIDSLKNKGVKMIIVGEKDE